MRVLTRADVRCPRGFLLWSSYILVLPGANRWAVPRAWLLAAKARYPLVTLGLRTGRRAGASVGLALGYRRRDRTGGGVEVGAGVDATGGFSREGVAPEEAVCG
jgi:hypothetical protein